MSGEHRKSREKSYPKDRLAKIFGVTCLTATFLLAGSFDTSIESPRVITYNKGPELQKEPQPVIIPEIIYDETLRLTRDTGMDMQPCAEFKVCGTDVAHPFLLPNGSVGYLLGDTFAVAGPFLKNIPPGEDMYRAQAMLRSNDLPTAGDPITFDSAAGLEGTGVAPEILGGWHMLVNDGVSLPNGDIIVSYQHTVAVENSKDNTWHTDYAGLAISHDGNNFDLTGLAWENDVEDNLDPYQMWSMQRDGDYVYIVSVRTGRREGPMMLFRSRWDQMLQQDAYEYWNGEQWGKKADAKPIQEGHFGEPSLRKLSDGMWVMSYTDYSHGPRVVTRTIVDPTQGPEGTWSEPKVQLTWKDLKNPYGGGIHPYSTKDNLILMISTWQTKGDSKEISERELVRYDVSHLNTAVE